jgi:hypothetical protein
VVTGEAMTLQPARSRLEAIYQSISIETLSPPRRDEAIVADAAREGV